MLKRHLLSLFIGLLILLALLVYSANLRQKTTTTLFERVVLTMTEPLQQGLDRMGAFLTGLRDNYLWLVDTRQQNVEVMRANRELRAQLVAVNEIRLENARLKRLLEFVEPDPRKVLPALVVAEDASSWAQTIVIDKGERHGLREGQPVVVAEGVVGRVIKVASNSARVLLVTDASSSIAGLVQSNRTRGVVRGSGRGLTLEYTLRNDPIETEDLVITSGMGGVFPKGLVLGRVAEIIRNEFGMFQQIQLIPVVDFSRLEEVLVLLEPES